ncbi:MAG: GNAT family N-acetyltransferase [Flavimaricola sp.]|nr:GNAT family N-acetyltransferase [Flavimaricola sp.]
MLIRVATRADITAIDALLSRAYPRLLKHDYAPSILVTAIPLIARAQPRLVTCGTYYVVEDGETLIAAGGWTAAIPGRGGSTPGRANVRHVVTDDRQTRRGVGTALLGHVMEAARAAGMTWMHCTSTRTAEPFYAALGFTRLGDVTVPLGPGIAFPAIDMRRDL